jgi:hypothetical protein
MTGTVSLASAAPTDKRTLLRETARGWYATVENTTVTAATSRALAPRPASLRVVDSRTGQLGDTILTYSLGRRYVEDMWLVEPLFDSRPALGVDDLGRVYMTDTVGYAINVFGADGRRIRTMRGTYTPRRVTQADVEAYATRLRRYMANPRFVNGAAQTRRFVDNRIAAWRPADLPPTGDMLVAPNGTVWVERPDLYKDPVIWEVRSFMPAALAPDDANAQPLWDRFDSTGTFRDRVAFPPRFRPVAVTDSTVIGVLTDHLDVQYVARYRLVRD